MKLGWMTDIHFDHLHNNRLAAFLERIRVSEADQFLITGDISTGARLDSNNLKICQHLRQIRTAAGDRTIHFVLGNHDFWYSSIDVVHREVNQLCDTHSSLNYLNRQPCTQLTPDTFLVGHDTWYDAMYGDLKKSNFRMYDWIVMDDYLNPGAAMNGGGGRVINVDLPLVVGISRGIAIRAVNHIETGIQAALDQGAKRVLVGSHLPPYPEAHIFEGKIGDDNAQPWFTSGLLGELLTKFATQNPDKIFVSFSGHTHGQYSEQKLKNLIVHVGGARYGHPEIAEIIEV